MIAAGVIAAMPHFGLPVDTCTSAGINTQAGREGTCYQAKGAFGGKTVFTVVDSGHTLQMSGYRARLIGSVSWIIPIAGPSNPDYPNATGLLVSADVAITNPGTAPLPFDETTEDIAIAIPPKPIHNSSQSGRPNSATPVLPNRDSHEKPQSPRMQPQQAGSPSSSHRRRDPNCTPAVRTSTSIDPAKATTMSARSAFGNGQTRKVKPQPRSPNPLPGELSAPASAWSRSDTVLSRRNWPTCAISVRRLRRP